MIVCLAQRNGVLDSKTYVLIILADLIRKSNGIEGGFPLNSL